MSPGSAEQCARLIREARRIGALTGAGISTNAGIPDFRGPKGLYVTRKYDPDKVFDIFHFLQDPAPFYEFARDFLGLTDTLKPTTAHYFLAKLEEKGKLSGIVTQNIDALHHQAGSRVVYEMHGSFLTSYCLDCRRKYTVEELASMLRNPGVPHCSCGGLIKPDIVFFGENVKYLDDSSRLAESCDLFLVIGSSCVVYPAAMIPTLCRGKIVVINHGPVHLDANVTLQVSRDADEFLGEVDGLLNSL